MPTRSRALPFTGGEEITVGCGHAAPSVPGSMTNVLVADQHPIVFCGITHAVESTSWLHVAGYARTGRETISAVESLRPDVLRLDIRLPDMPAPHAGAGDGPLRARKA